jgi:hypothetical protein
MKVSHENVEEPSYVSATLLFDTSNPKSSSNLTGGLHLFKGVRSNGVNSEGSLTLGEMEP